MSEQIFPFAGPQNGGLMEFDRPVLFIRRPSGVDEGTILRIRQIRPVEEAVNPIIDHNLLLLDSVAALAPWYRGERTVSHTIFLSGLLNPADNTAREMLSDLVRTALEFEPGAFPSHCDAFRRLQFTTTHLIRTLAELAPPAGAMVFSRALKCAGHLFAAMEDPAASTYSWDEMKKRLMKRLEMLLDSFMAISQYFFQLELSVAFAAPAPAATVADVHAAVEDVKRTVESSAAKVGEKVDEANGRLDTVLAVAGETKETVRRIDRRDSRRHGRQKYTDAELKAIHDIWLAGQRNPNAKTVGKGRITKEEVFAHYSLELRALGIRDAAAFKKAIKLYNDRFERKLSLT